MNACQDSVTTSTHFPTDWKIVNMADTIKNTKSAQMVANSLMYWNLVRKVEMQRFNTGKVMSKARKPSIKYASLVQLNRLARIKT